MFTSVRLSENSGSEDPAKVAAEIDNNDGKDSVGEKVTEEEYLGDGFDYPNNGEVDNIKVSFVADSII